MKIAVIGGTGFIGSHLINLLLHDGHNLIVTGTNSKKASEISWFNKVEFLELNIADKINEAVFKKLADADKVVHLAWSGLPGYKELYHFEENLMPQYSFLKKLIEAGAKDLTVTGTCFEYGLRNGCLDATLISDPQNPYALAKDTLRKFLQQLQKYQDFKLKWLRLFYMFGEGQSPNSILSKLDLAIKNGDKVFNMSPGEQLRDYLPVSEVSLLIAEYCLKDVTGVFNCCSGIPVSIRTLVENHLKENNQSIELNLGYYPYPDYEPMAFWGKP